MYVLQARCLQSLYRRCIHPLQAELTQEIDPDHEITAVGAANLAAGLLAGGGTGAHKTRRRVMNLCVRTLDADTPLPSKAEVSLVGDMGKR